MPITCKKYYFIFPLKGVWEHICYVNSDIKPTQYYDYYKHLFRTFYLHPKKAIRHRPIFYHIRDGANECIIPLVVYDKKKNITGFSYYGRLDYEDVIATSNDTHFIQQCLRTVLSDYSGYRINISNINEKSSLYYALKEKLQGQEQCVTIHLPSSYEKYFEGVSKHQRQNIRTAYNRLTKEDFKIELQQYNREHSMPTKIWKICERIYEQRHDEGLGRWKTWFTRQTNPYHKILSKNCDRLAFVLYHNQDVMAYMAGIYNAKQQCYYVPRLCINNQYATYSPGILLINEAIKILIAQGVYHLDLMQGNEPYKIAMGGIPINNYQLHCVWQGLTTE